jgi:hypothetical protein
MTKSLSIKTFKIFRGNLNIVFPAMVKSNKIKEYIKSEIFI